MTESEWARCADPDAMLAFLRDAGKLTERKARLFAVACCRRIWHLLTDERSRRAVEVAERYADGAVTRRELDVARAGVRAICIDKARRTPWLAAAAAARHTAGLQRWYSTSMAAQDIRSALGTAPTNAEGFAQAALLRDLVGPLPFRPLPSLPPSVRTWNDGAIAKLATAIYEERSLPSGHLHPHRLAVLADAIEEAGVTAPDVLGHLREQGAVHARGCWPLDLLLEKS